MDYTNKIVNTKREIYDDDISKVELKFNFTYPNDIRNHFLQYNGGEPLMYIFVDQDGDEFIVQQFIPIKYGHRTIDALLNNLRNENILPNWLIPFADDPGGDLFCISLSQETYGQIFIWEHEVIDNDENPAYFISESLEQFINSLQEDS